MEKINVAELLKDCPEGMELDCTNYDGLVKFDGFNKNNPYAIRIIVFHDGCVNTHNLTKYGQTSVSSYNKCVIFPKGKTTWEGFVPPYKFKDGDVIVTGNEYKCVAIFKNAKSFYDSEGFNYYVLIPLYIKEATLRTDDWIDGVDTRLATEEEKQKLFKTIKEHGYKWNTEIKTLENLDVLPIFKVGECIKHLTHNSVIYTVIGMTDTHYMVKSDGIYAYEYQIPISTQDKYELVPKKFDITTLKPFDKVLVRTKSFTPCWTIDFFDGYQPEIGGSFTPFGVTGGKYFQQCIPYEGNEHLRATTNDCDDFYKTWK